MSWTCRDQGGFFIISGYSREAGKISGLREMEASGLRIPFTFPDPEHCVSLFVLLMSLWRWEAFLESGGEWSKTHAGCKIFVND